jgi:hypothetical protein
MTALLRQLRCRLFGHPDAYVVWDIWRQPEPALGPVRMLREECVRCGRVLAISSIGEAEWTRQRTRDAQR